MWRTSGLSPRTRPTPVIKEAQDENGVLRYYQTTKMIFTDPAGRMYLLGTLIDITEMVAAEQAAAKTQAAYEYEKSENTAFSRIVQTLSSDYLYIYSKRPCVLLEPIHHTEYQSVSRADKSKSL